MNTQAKLVDVVTMDKQHDVIIYCHKRYHQKVNMMLSKI